MILIIKATRKSTIMGDMPDVGEKYVQGSQIYEFEVPYPGSAPTVVVDCQSKHAFDMFQVRGDRLPQRACPIRPKGVVAGKDGPPDEWVDQKTGRIKPEIFVRPGQDPLSPSDVFTVVSIADCQSCTYASRGTVALDYEQKAIREAFQTQLSKENFSGTDLGDEDRDQNRWQIHWDDVEIA